MSSNQTILTQEERSNIQRFANSICDSSNRNPMAEKLLLCLLETIQTLSTEISGLKSELSELKKVNQQINSFLQDEVTTSTVYYGKALKIHTC